MIIKLNDEDARLVRAVLLEKAQEHSSYAETSEVAARLYTLAAGLESRVIHLLNMTTA